MTIAKRIMGSIGLAALVLTFQLSADDDWNQGNQYNYSQNTNYNYSQNENNDYSQNGNFNYSQYENYNYSQNQYDSNYQSDSNYQNDSCCQNDCCENEDSGFYFGAQVGYVNTHWSNIDQNAFANSEIVIKKDYGVGVRPYVGYALNKYLGFEFGWTYLNRATTDRWNALDFNNVRLAKIQNQAYDVSLRLSVPIFEDAGLFTRVGLSYLISHGSVKWRANSLQAITARPFRHNPSTYNVTFAFGAYYDLTCNLRAEVSWTRFGGNTETTDNYQPSPDFYAIGLSYRI